MVALPPGRLLGPVVLRALIRPSDATVEVWRRPAGDDADAIDPGRFAPRFTAAVNQVRKLAGRSSVSLSDVESRRAAQLAGHYFAAAAGMGDPTAADRVALGMMAGWGLAGGVSRGHFSAAHASSERGPAGLVAAMMLRPSGRLAMVSDKVRTLAVGPLFVSGAPVAGVIVAGYEPFTAVDSEQGRQQVMELLQAARAAAGVGPARRLGEEFDAMAEEAARAVEGGGTVDDELEGLLFRAAHAVMGGGVRGLALYAADLADLELPEDVVRRPQLEIAVAVGAYRPPRHPWTSPIAYLLYVEPDAGTFAGNPSAAGQPPCSGGGPCEIAIAPESP